MSAINELINELRTEVHQQGGQASLHRKKVSVLEVVLVQEKSSENPDEKLMDAILADISQRQLMASTASRAYEIARRSLEVAEAVADLSRPVSPVPIAS